MNLVGTLPLLNRLSVGDIHQIALIKHPLYARHSLRELQTYRG